MEQQKRIEKLEKELQDLSVACEQKGIDIKQSQALTNYFQEGKVRNGLETPKAAATVCPDARAAMIQDCRFDPPTTIKDEQSLFAALTADILEFNTWVKKSVALFKVSRDIIIHDITQVIQNAYPGCEVHSACPWL